MRQITREMTVKEALPFVSPTQRINLRPWAEEFGIQLRQFHVGHIKTFKSLRLRLVSLDVVNSEVSTLLGLLDLVGVEHFLCGNRSACDVIQATSSTQLHQVGPLRRSHPGSTNGARVASHGRRGFCSNSSDQRHAFISVAVV